MPDSTPARRRLHGVDFTSAPRSAKPITVASGYREADRFCLDNLQRLADWQTFEAWLRRPGPWLAGFDFPFGLPREAVHDLHWPGQWDELVRHCQSLGRAGLRAAFDAHRMARPAGARYAHRATDRPAGSHSPMKLVNPPVGLMFLEGSTRLLAADLTVPGIRQGDPNRVAIEAYPGMLARRITRESYKSDTKAKQTLERHRVRTLIVTQLMQVGVRIEASHLRLEASSALAQQLIDEPGGDLLDATLAAIQAAWCDQQQAWHHGLPADTDPIEGWIAGAPWSTM